MDRTLHFLRRFGPLLLVAAAIVAVIASGLLKHLSLDELRDRRVELEAYVHGHYFATLAAYVGVYAAFVCLCLPGVVILTLAGGFLFGPWVGALAATAGCTIGACIIFVIGRNAAGDLIERISGPTARRIEAGVKRNALLYLLSVRLIPVMPFWLINLASALLEIRLRDFALATGLGILPASLIFAALGSDLRGLFAQGKRVDLEFMLEPRVMLPLIGIAALSLAPAGVAWWRGRRNGAPPESPPK